MIRDLLPSDLEAAARLNAANVPAVGAADAAHLAYLLTRSCLALAIPAPKGELAAFALALGPGSDYTSMNYRWFNARYQDFVYLDRVAVAQPFRRQGLGRALYEEIARRSPAAWFLLEVNLRPRNEDSMRFHERLGFVEVGQQETDYGARVSLQAAGQPVPGTRN